MSSGRAYSSCQSRDFPELICLLVVLGRLCLLLLQCFFSLRSLVSMDFPCVVTPACPKWPIKRQRVGSAADLNLEIGGGLSLEGNRLSVKADYSLTFGEDNSLGVKPALVKPFLRDNVIVPGDFSCRNFRIPFILSLQNDNIILGSDLRFDSTDDFHRTSIGIAISADGGLTWPFKTVALAPDKTLPTARFLDGCVVQAPNGDIFLFAVYFENANHLSSTDPNFDFVYTLSRDGGYTWSKPVSLKHLYRTGQERYFFQCPGIGIVMEDGTIVVPCQSWVNNNECHSTMIFSNDEGVTWQRAAGHIPLSTTECQICEFPVAGTLLLVARKEGTPNTINARTRAVYVSTNKGATWTAHKTNGTIRMKNPCMGSLLKIVGPSNEWIALHASPNVDSQSFTQGRSNLTLQYLTAYGSEWVPIGTIDKRVTWGYSGITLNRKFNKLLIVGEVNYFSALSVCVYDCTRYLGLITQSFDTNVNLGYSVTVNAAACKLGEEPLRYRRVGKEIWLAGQIVPPTDGTFPSTVTKMFEFRLPAGLSSRLGWITVFGSKTYPGTIFYPFILEYYWEEGGPNLGVRCFANSASIAAENALSAMKVLYVPDSRVGIMC